MNFSVADKIIGTVFPKIYRAEYILLHNICLYYQTIILNRIVLYFCSAYLPFPAVKQNLMIEKLSL